MVDWHLKGTPPHTMAPGEVLHVLIVRVEHNIDDDWFIEGVLSRPSKKIPLTDKQRQTYDFIAGYVQSRGYAPTYKEIAEHFHWKSLATVSEHMVQLQRRRWIVRERNRARHIQLLP